MLATSSRARINMYAAHVGVCMSVYSQAISRLWSAPDSQTSSKVQFFPGHGHSLTGKARGLYYHPNPTINNAGHKTCKTLFVRLNTSKWPTSIGRPPLL